MTAPTTTTLPVTMPETDPRAQPDVRSDYRAIVIGSGISGLFVALEARHLGPILVLTKGSIDDCNTRWAQGGIAAALGPLDSPEQHLADTITAGAGLVDLEAARILCYEAPARIRDLIRYGVAFDSLGGEVALGREAAHSHSRILHAGGDRTGAAIENALGAAALDPTITILDFTLATAIVKDERGRVTGVEAIDLGSGRTERYQAPAVIIATGGAGQLFSHTTNPEIATGDGIALGFAAGAEVADLEFYQFHPTALRVPGAPAFLISEAVRGEGAVLRNDAGEAFMARYHGLKELAPRDIVARALVAEMRDTGADHVLLDCTGLKSIDLAARFPGIFAFCKSVGIDMREQPIPVAPAAHYLMGGVRTDVNGRTTVPGLYACGEVACTGVHGANRLASNSLMETVVFGKRVVEALAAEDQSPAAAAEDTSRVTLPPGRTGTKAELQRLMWQCAGIEREVRGLEGALTRLTEAGGEESITPRSREAWERAQMHVVSRLMLEAALRRTESRGAHYRGDYPERDDRRWQRRQVFRRAD
ncbi:MAG: L-aspartate oxidase [Dehalococcoidia bacterium]